MLRTKINLPNTESDLLKNIQIITRSIAEGRRRSKNGQFTSTHSKDSYYELDLNAQQDTF